MIELIRNGRRLHGSSTPALRREQQSLTPGPRVELYTVDLNPIGVSAVFYLTPFSEDDGTPVKFGGVTYTQVPIAISEIEKGVTGEQQEAKLFLPNIDKFAASMVRQYEDLVGAEVTRITTFADFLDDHPQSDPNARLGYEVFIVEQKQNLNLLWGEFALRVMADTANRMIPGRQAFKDMCSWRYRYWDAVDGAFKYTDTRPCPYAGSAYFKEDGTSTANPAEDFCGGDLTGCEARYGEGTKPFGGFPGMGRYRIA